jgi:hypothetical protein
MKEAEFVQWYLIFVLGDLLGCAIEVNHEDANKVFSVVLR